MTFCSNCGEPLNGELFCPKCGTKNENVQSKKAIGKYAVLIIPIIVVAFLICLLFGGRSYRSVTKAYINAELSGNGNKIASLMPKKLIERSMETWGISDKDDFIEEFITESAEDNSEDLLAEADGKKSRISYKITGSSDFSNSELAYLQDDWDDSGLKIKDGKYVDVEINIKGSESKYTKEVTVVKIGRKWYLWREMY